MNQRRVYSTQIEVNGILIKKIIIDDHYELNHKESINDEIILKLVQTLHGRFYEYEIKKGSFYYFVVDRILFLEKMYRLIWLLEHGQNYIGVINAYRSKS